MTIAIFVGVDWGTTHVRAWAFDDRGTVFDRRSTTEGAGALSPAQFSPALARLVAGWTNRDTPILLGGMAGSKEGWRETPYLTCPTEIAGSIRSAIRIDDAAGAVRILPGLRSDGPDGSIDLMRGEEVQIWGSGVENGTVLLPGTHSKWAIVAGGLVESFSTYLTGELFAAVRSQTLIGRGMGEPGHDTAAFDQGVDRALAGASLSRLLFGVRTEVLTGGVSLDASADFLSGILIGAEIAAAIGATDRRLTIIGAPLLVERYNRALRLAGAKFVGAVDGEVAAQRGLTMIYEAMRLIA